MENWTSPAVIPVPAMRDELGALGVVEKDSPFPFPIKRVYFLYDVPADAVRGSHAHKALHQLIIPVAGSFRVELDDGRERRDFLLSNPAQGLTVPPGYWRTLREFSAGSAALVLASEEYDPSDYIRDYDEFVAWANRG
ncbi:MAG: FdtA/QdtA family cupin domain-containing protein [Protaetiibacter sp.]